MQVKRALNDYLQFGRPKAKCSFDPLRQPTVGGQPSAAHELIQPSAKLSQGVHRPVAVKALAPGWPEEPLAHHCGDSTISRIIVVKPLAHDAEKAILARMSDPDLAMHRCWA
jgi:hypothetical protein